MAWTARSNVGRVPGARSTQAVGLNDLGQVVGEYQNPDGTYHGFLWRRGRITTIDAPGAVATSLVDVDDRGQLLGARVEPDGAFRGFVLDRGRFTSFDVPGAPIIFPRDLNNHGQIVGFSASDPADLTTIRGFLLAKGANGPFTPISRPGAAITAPFGINDRGQIVGVAENPEATPSPQRTSTPPMGGMPSPLVGS